MKVNRLQIVIYTVVLATLVSCKKDKLVGDLDLFKGRYTWEYSVQKEYWYSLSTITIPAANSNYTAEIEFNSKGKIIFYIDGQQIHKTGYSIEQQETTNNGNTISLKLNPRIEDSKEIDLNNFIDITITNDTLTVDDFPGESYDENLGGIHYFLRN